MMFQWSREMLTFLVGTWCILPRQSSELVYQERLLIAEQNRRPREHSLVVENWNANSRSLPQDTQSSTKRQQTKHRRRCWWHKKDSCVQFLFTVVVPSLSCVQFFVTPLDCSMPGFFALHQLPEFAKTHVHWVDDAIQSFHPLLPHSPPALDLSQHQGLF